MNRMIRVGVKYKKMIEIEPEWGTLEYLSCLKDVDIDKELQKKMEINDNRSYKHGGKLV